MHSLFRAFSRGRVRALVIGGQAAILYGAAHFTQDLDLWIDPSPRNVRRFLRALASLNARVHKLTPPLAPRWLRAGHGFHFVVPQPGGQLYLDAMGFPPRARPFATAWYAAERFETPWGTLRSVAIEDLVELKKTNRPADYDVITRLALLRAGRDKEPSSSRLRWCVRNIFRVEDLAALVREFGPRCGSDRAVRHLLKNPSKGVEAAAALLAEKAHRLQQAGRRYWLPRIAELRRLRAAGGLLREGLPVAEITGGCP
jgi:hypothetical protein